MFLLFMQLKMFKSSSCVNSSVPLFQNCKLRKQSAGGNPMVEVYIECTNQRLDNTFYATAKGKQSMGRRTNGQPIADKGKILKS